MTISPQGYKIEKDPTSTHPFWNNGSSELPTGLPGQILEANESGEFVASDSLIDLKSEVNNLKEELTTVHQDQEDIGNDVNTISGNVNHLAGGTTGQILYKTGNADFAFGWKDESEFEQRGMRVYTTGDINLNGGGIPVSSTSINVYIQFNKLTYRRYYNDGSGGNYISSTFPIYSDFFKTSASGNNERIVKFSCSNPISYPWLEGTKNLIDLYGTIEINSLGVITKINLYSLDLDTLEIINNTENEITFGSIKVSGLYYTEDVVNV